jgi:hypothetical protein
MCLFVLAAGLTLSNIGCVVVLGSCDFPEHAKLVEIDGELYIADKETKRLHKLGGDWEIQRKTVTHTEGTTDADIETTGG